MKNQNFTCGGCAQKNDGSELAYYLTIGLSKFCSSLPICKDCASLFKLKSTKKT